MPPYGDFSADLPAIPVVDVDKFNWNQIWPKMSVAVKMADFVAVDCELSGLGDRKKLCSSDMDERYSNLSVVAKTRSVLALGVSCFKKIESDANVNYCVQTYNILTLADEDYIVEPGSINFLLQHGFNFQEQYQRGVPYRRGNDKDGEGSGLRDLFSLFVTSGSFQI